MFLTVNGNGVLDTVYDTLVHANVVLTYNTQDRSHLTTCPHENPLSMKRHSNTTDESEGLLTALNRSVCKGQRKNLICMPIANKSLISRTRKSQRIGQSANANLLVKLHAKATILFADNQNTRQFI
jgi:hypothetical protein